MARRVHGITNEAVADAPVFNDIAFDVLEALSHSALIAHNAHVDVDVLQRKATGWECPEVFDTLKLARRFAPDQMSHWLGSLVEAFKLAEGMSPELRPHRATYDAVVTARLFQVLATTNSVPRSLEELRGQPSGGGDHEVATHF